MPWAILIIGIVILAIIGQWIEHHQTAARLIALLVLAGIIAASWRAFLYSDWYQKRQAARLTKESAAEQARAAKIAAEKLAEIETKPVIASPPLSVEELSRRIKAQYYENNISLNVIEPYYLSQLIITLAHIYEEKGDTARDQTRVDTLYINTCVNALSAMTPTLPPSLRGKQPEQSSFFSLKPYVEPHDEEDPYLNIPQVRATVEISGAISNFGRVFKDARESFQQARVLEWKGTEPYVMTMLGQPPAHDASEASNERYDKRWEQNLKEMEVAIRALPNYKLALLGTPLFSEADYFLPPPAKVPFELSSGVRSRHQWIIGAPGAGKTTFISAMIADDLKKVARNECSIFVMDSQNELVPDISKLEMFAPGRPLHNKLIYLEPEPDYPLALNIFDTNKGRLNDLSSKDRAMLESGAIWMVEFFLSSLVKSEATPHQDTFLNYVIPALMAIPDATIFTFKDLLEGAKTKGGETGYDRYKQHFGALRKDSQDWLRDRMHSTELALTRNAIRARLDGFTARGFFHDMFTHPRNKLDLFEEMQTGKVILVNTSKGLLKNGTEPFGRYFIARLLQAAEERMFLSRGTRLPVYCYIDEASDYIKEEENIEELINKARKQNVALVIANQMESQITSPIVRDALSRVAIQCRGEPGEIGQPPKWQIAIGNQAPVDIQVPNVNFASMPQMSTDHYEQMLMNMRRRFSSPVGGGPNNGHSEPPRPEQDGAEARQHARPDEPTGPPKDDEFDARYDMFELMRFSPLKARDGFVLTVTAPNGRTHSEGLRPGTKNGFRFCVRGGSQYMRPDGKNGNFWVELEIPNMERSKPDDNETDAKPW